MAKKKQEQRAKERIGVTIQLIVGEDDDLINAIIDIPNGERQMTLKTVLRQALGMPLPAKDVQTIVQSIVDEQELYERIHQRVMADLEQKLNTPYTPPAPPSVQAADQLDSRIAMERKNRLKGADW